MSSFPYALQELLIHPYSELNDHQLAALALSNAINKKNKNAEKLLMRVNPDTKDPITKTMVLETKLTIDISKKKQWQEIDQLANKILDIYPKAVMARVAIARNRIFFEKNYTKGIQYIEEISSDWPKIDWTYRRLISYLILIGEKKLALNNLQKISSPSVYSLYKFYIMIYLPYRILIWTILGGLLITTNLLSFDSLFVKLLYVMFFSVLRIIVGIWDKNDFLFNREIAASFVFPILIYYIFIKIYPIIIN